MHIYYSGIGATKSKMTLDEFILFVKMNHNEKETIQYIYENQNEIWSYDHHRCYTAIDILNNASQYTQGSYMWWICILDAQIIE